MQVSSNHGGGDDLKVPKARVHPPIPFLISPPPLLGSSLQRPKGPKKTQQAAGSFTPLFSSFIVKSLKIMEADGGMAARKGLLAGCCPKVRVSAAWKKSLPLPFHWWSAWPQTLPGVLFWRRSLGWAFPSSKTVQRIFHGFVGYLGGAVEFSDSAVDCRQAQLRIKIRWLRPQKKANI